MFCVEKKTCGLLSQRRTKGRLLNLHFVLPRHAHLDSVIPSGEQVFPLGCQRPAGVTEILKGAPEEAKDWIGVRLSAPRQYFV